MERAFPMTTALPQAKVDQGPTKEEFYRFLYDMTLGQLGAVAESARKLTHDVGQTLGVSRGVRPEYEAKPGDLLTLGLAMAPMGKVGRYFRETSPQRAQMLIPHPRFKGALVGGDTSERLYFAKNPDLAIGQGTNRGVLLEFSDDLPLKARPKPGTSGEETMEFFGQYIPQREYVKALRSITFKPDMKIPKGEVPIWRSFIKQYEDAGWKRSKGPNGELILERPGE